MHLSSVDEDHSREKAQDTGLGLVVQVSFRPQVLLERCECVYVCEILLCGLIQS